MKIITETPRLIIREITVDDYSDLFAIYSDKETMTYYPAPFDKTKVQNLINKCIQDYSLYDHCLWALILKSNMKFIGDCGIIRQTVEGLPENEIGYHLNKHYRKKGYATEAALACKEIGFGRFKYYKLISLIRPENKASRRVAERLHFSILGKTHIFDFDHYIYGQMKTDNS